MPMNNAGNCIQGVTCDVQNCKHNDMKKGCTANHIQVGPKNAVISSETVCDSFQLR